MNKRNTLIKSLASEMEAITELDSSLGITYHNIPGGLDKLNLNPIINNNSQIPKNNPNTASNDTIYTQSIGEVLQTNTLKQPSTSNPTPKLKLQGDTTKIAQITSLMNQVSTCTSCQLAASRKNPVHCEGSVDAAIAFIGSAPGREEDNFGLPFQGAAGKLITDIIEKGMKMPRNAVYLSSIVKCRPKGNREPLATEIECCRHYLKQELSIVQPQIIIAVGTAATNILTAQNSSIEQTRGIWYKYNGIPVMPIYHPSFLLRQRRKLGQTNDYVRNTWGDIKQVLAHLG